MRDRLIEIADALNARGISDAEFAKYAKVSRSAVSQWRKGDVTSLKALSAVNIQERTGYSVRWLILGIGPKKLSGTGQIGTGHAADHTLSAKDEHKLLVILRSFLDTDDEGRQQIVEAVEAVTGNGSGQPERKTVSKRR